MNVTRLAVLGVALVAGIGAFVLMMSNKPAPSEPVQIVEQVQEKTARVLVADRDFVRGERIDAESVRWVEWFEKSIAKTFIREDSGVKIQDLVGSVVRASVVKGEPMIETKVVRAGASGLMAAVLSPGMRAVTMRVSPETASGGFILPGDRVDVLHSLISDTDEARTQTILRDVKVLAINTVFTENPKKPYIEGSNLTLELSPLDAEFFTSARSSRGELSLALRSIFESEQSGGAQRRNNNVEIIRYGRS